MSCHICYRWKGKKKNLLYASIEQSYRVGNKVKKRQVTWLGRVFGVAFGAPGPIDLSANLFGIVEPGVKAAERFAAKVEREQAKAHERQLKSEYNIGKWEERTGLKMPSPVSDPTPVEKGVPDAPAAPEPDAPDGGQH